MNIKNISVGQIIKNYKALCAELEVEIKGGKSKKYQLRDLERYIKYSRQGHKYIIEEIYDIPKEKIGIGQNEGSRGNNNKYGNMFQLLLLNILAQNRGEITRTRNQLLLETDMINQNYVTCGENIPTLALYLEMDERIIYDFYNISRSNLRSTVESTLKSMEDRAFIIYDKVTRVATSTVHRTATSEEKQIILKCQGLTLDEFNFKNISQARVSSRWKIFRHKLNQNLYKMSNGEIQYSYDAYKITINEDRIYEQYEDLLDLALDDIERDEHKGELNATVYYEFIKSAKKRHEKGFTSRKFSSIRLKKDYVLEITRLIKLLIDDGAMDIRSNIEALKEK